MNGNCHLYSMNVYGIVADSELHYCIFGCGFGSRLLKCTVYIFSCEYGARTNFVAESNSDSYLYYLLCGGLLTNIALY